MIYLFFCKYINIINNVINLFLYLKNIKIIGKIIYGFLFFKNILLVNVVIKQKVRKIRLTQLLLFRNFFFYFFFGGIKSILYPFDSPNAIFIIILLSFLV